MAFYLGLKSLIKLRGVHPDLVRVVKRAIQTSTVDFTVLEGLRTIERQKQLVAAGASRTMNSRHITGHAIDLGAMVSGHVRWDWPLYAKIADAMKQAAKELGVDVEWGGVWDKTLNELSSNLEKEHSDYVARMRTKGKNALSDGPHFQLGRKSYP